MFVRILVIFGLAWSVAFAGVPMQGRCPEMGLRATSDLTATTTAMACCGASKDEPATQHDTTPCPMKSCCIGPMSIAVPIVGLSSELPIVVTVSVANSSAIGLVVDPAVPPPRVTTTAA